MTNKHFLANHTRDILRIGENRTLVRLKEKHDWKHIEQDVKEFINRCDICQREKLTRIRQKGEAVITDRNQREGCPRYIRTLA